jgi:hypothetical protein
MPDPALAPRRPRLKLLLAAALAAASVALPLSPVWRAHSEEIEALAAERALLDPLTRAHMLQRNLLDHADVSTRVLQGRGALEPERRLRQHLVDTELVGLQATLAAGLWTRALGEAQAMAQGWRTLTWQVAQRSIRVPAARDAHQLLVEQTVVVMDLVTSAAPPERAALLRLAPRQPGAASAAALQARLQAVEARQAAAREARAATAAAGVAAALLMFATLAWLLLRHGAVPAGSLPPSTPRDDVRRSHGRRRTDAAAPSSIVPWSGLDGTGPGRAASAPDTLSPPAGKGLR